MWAPRRAGRTPSRGTFTRDPLHGDGRPGRGALGDRRRGEVDDEAGAASRRRLETHLAAVLPCDRVDDRQPEPDEPPRSPPPRTKRSKMRSRSSSGIPGPSSDTSGGLRSPALRTAACTFVPGGVWRRAFSIRLSAIRCSSSREPRTIAGSGASTIEGMGLRLTGSSSAAASTTTAARSVGRAARPRAETSPAWCARRRGPAAAGRRPGGASAGTSAARCARPRPARRRGRRRAARGWPARWSAACAARARRRRRTGAGGPAQPPSRPASRPAQRACR